MTSSSGGRIPDAFIESVLAKTDLVALIKESIELKKSGANYSACCPFHSEKTPSFTVSAVKQFYHCFGCGAHGDAIRFLMEHRRLHFTEAVEALANRIGLEVPRTQTEEGHIRQSLAVLSILDQAAHYYAEQWKNDLRAKTAIHYLKNRGVTGKIAKTFGLGYAPPDWDNLIMYFARQPEATALLVQAGLVIQHESGRYYDRFRDRILFPIRDARGKVIGFGGRVIGEGQPKYLNSPETIVFQKSHCLYGMHEALRASSKWEQAIVVEGYLDVIMLAQQGVTGAVATLGTAFTPYHLQQLFQRVKEVVFCFDGDAAGRAAAWKALQLVLPCLLEDRRVRFAFLPGGEDPDSYIRRVGADGFRATIQGSASVSEYFFTALWEQNASRSLDDRARLATVAKPLIEQIPTPIFREMMFEQLAQLVSSSPDVVKGGRAQRTAGRWKAASKKDPMLPPPRIASLVFTIVAILLRDPNLAKQLEAFSEHSEYMDSLSGDQIDLLKQVIKLLFQVPTLCSEELREWLMGQALDRKALADGEKKVALINAQGLEAELVGAWSQLRVTAQERYTEQLLQKARTLGLSEGEKCRLREILQTKGNQ